MFNYAQKEITDVSIIDDLRILGAKGKGESLLKPKSLEDQISMIQGRLTHANHNLRTLNAFSVVDKKNFLPEDIKDPYSFTSHIFQAGQTLPSPHIVFANLQILGIERGERVLEIGAGAGYGASLLSKIVGPAGRVLATELIPELVEVAKKATEDLHNVYIKQSKEIGFPDFAPYDKIFTTLAATNEPIENLLDQLVVGGRMLISAPRLGNTKIKEDAKLWTPGDSIKDSDLYLANEENQFYRIATYLFEKESKSNVSYQIVTQNGIGPLMR